MHKIGFLNLSTMHDATSIGTDEDYQCIEQAAGIKSPNNAFRDELATTIQNWANGQLDDSANFRPAATMKSLKQVAADAARLHQSLSDESLFDLCYQEYIWGDEFVFGHELEDSMSERKPLVEHLESLIQILNSILAAAPKHKGGRPPDLSFLALLGGLTHIYERETGRKAGVTYHGTYQGPYFRFVRECIRRLVPDFCRQDATLGKALQRYLKHGPVRL